MKVLTKIGIGVGAVIALPFVVALFVPSDYAIEREITINKPKQEVFEYIKYLKNQEKYSKWAMMDPGMKRTYEGIDGTVGFIAGWESKNKELGVGEQEIMKVIEGDSLVTELRFKEPFENKDKAYFATESVSPRQTKVKWGFKGAFPYPMNLMNLFIDFDKELGRDLEIGLQNMKQNLEVKK